ncbi:MAG: class II aldolase/adducin family protein [Oscillospiraceae bacterium]|nr:class II aldolase/adducin family protein [Oscillospiraceae bacterium]
MNETAARALICEVGQKLWQQGWVAANDGNISVKLAADRFLATPTGVSKSLLTPEMLLLVDATGQPCAGSVGHPSSEIKMHMKCYELREDVGAVVHAHPPAATGFAVAGLPLDGYNMIETVVTLGSVPLTPYGTPSTEEVPAAIAPFLADHDALLLENHGALTVGADLMTAYYRMETLELWAKISLNARLLGGAKELSRENIDKLLVLRKHYYKVSGRHPGYKKYT